jgi:hypothetical protein
MRIVFYFSFILTCTLLNCETNTPKVTTSADVLNKYLTYSIFTDPGEYSYLFRKKKLNSAQYVSRYEHIAQAIIHLLVHDISYILVEEKPYWDDPKVVSRLKLGISNIPQSKNESPRSKVRGIKPMRSLDYRSGSVRLNDFDNKIKVSLIQVFDLTARYLGDHDKFLDGIQKIKRENKFLQIDS